MGPVEVVPAVRHRWVVPLSEVGSAACGADVFVPCASHVVDDGVHVDPVDTETSLEKTLSDESRMILSLEEALRPLRKYLSTCSVRTR